MRAHTLAVVLLILSAGCLSGMPASEGGAGPATPVPTGAQTLDSSVDGDRVTVVDVVDGDTVKVAYENGTRETVRLLGVDTPEVHGSNSPEEFEGIPETDAGASCLRRAGERASAYATDRLAGETVTLVFDEQSDRRGYYGRLLAYVFVNGESFNHALLREGHARVYESTFTERERYERTEAMARDDRRGLWSCADPDAGSVAADSTGDASATRTDGGAPLTIAELHPDAEGNDNENPNDEYVVFRNSGDEPLDVSGWTVTDAADHTYTFPDGTVVEPGAELTLRTGSGTDTDATVYWGAGGAVWNNGGDVVLVRDTAGSTVLRRSY
ncbi:lamin tail domain-containing protein [Halobellus litoreus]|uniref:Lamin tail domain-containing protein n=1 Tax=Halobellus litoreus TaxID=755310 RepID=A0ABD6DUI7_9EURY|nr:lamin tail domain-containing protein [Halobellus litoreus]